MALATTQSNPLEDYNKEVGELKALVKDALEKKGVLAKIKADLRAGLYDLLEERDRLGTENDPKTIVGCCSDQAKALHSSKAGALVAALVCEYLDWANMEQSLKVYMAECDLPPALPSRAKLIHDMGLTTAAGSNEHQPLLLDVLDAFAKAKKSAPAEAAPKTASDAPPPVATSPQTTGQAPSPSAAAAARPRSSSPLLRAFSRGGSDKGSASERSSSASRRRVAAPRGADGSGSDTERAPRAGISLAQFKD